MARHRRAFAFSARVSQVGVSSKAELEMRALGRVRLAPTVTRGATLALAAALPVPPLAAQLPAADEAFRKGDYAAARAGYERVLAADSLNERALYRLAILDSWDGELARSLARFGRLRRLDPKDGDFMVAQAQVLAWAGKTRASEALYDSAPPAPARPRTARPATSSGRCGPRSDPKRALRWMGRTTPTTTGSWLRKRRSRLRWARTSGGRSRRVGAAPPVPFRATRSGALVRVTAREAT